VDSSRFHSNELRLEEDFRATESLIYYGDHVSIGEFIGFLKSRALRSFLHLSVKIQSNIAKLLLDVSDNFTFGSGLEGVSTFSQDFHQVLSEVTSSKVQTENGVGKSISLIDGHSVGNTISRVKNNTGGTP
jgi:hypothetical protein